MVRDSSKFTSTFRSIFSAKTAYFFKNPGRLNTNTKEFIMYMQSGNIYIFIILINNSQRKDKGNQWHDGGCISETKFY